MKTKTLILFLIFSKSTGLFAQIDSAATIQSWQMSGDYLYKIPTEIDTSLEFFHVYNPIYKYSFGNAFLGNSGSPVESQLYFDQKGYSDFMFTQVYYPYLETVGKTEYFNTRRQFSMLEYINGGTSSTREERFSVFHTQNIKPNLNFGIKFTTMGSAGQYQYQRTKRNSIKAFASYEGEILTTYFNINTNNFSTDENGGLQNDSSLINQAYNTPSNIPTLFSGSSDNSNVNNTFKNLSLEFSNKIDLLNLFSKKDTVPGDSLKSTGSLGLIHVFSMEFNKRMFTDKMPSIGQVAGLYDSLYFNAGETFDSISFHQFTSDLRIYYATGEKMAWSFALTNEWIDYTLFSKDNALGLSYPVDHKSYRPFTLHHVEVNTKVSANADILSRMLEWHLAGNYYLLGYKKGGYNLGIMLGIGNGKTGNRLFNASATYFLQQPLFLQNTYYSNTFIWNNSFNPVKKLHLSLKYGNSPKKFEPRINYSLLRGVIFADTNAYPKQYSSSLQVFSASVQKKFNFWKFSSLNNIAFQFVNKDQVLSLPAVVFYNSTFFQQRIYFKFTGGEFFTSLGFDMYYNTKYYAPAYMPSLSGFYNQTDKRTGNYPYVDIFLDIKLKRARFFFKFEHVNYGWLENEYFSVLHYPRNERMFKVGLSWNFYD